MRYYLHTVTDAELIRDPEGAEFADLEAAATEAVQSGRDLIAEELRQGRSVPLNWRVLISTADDTVLRSIPFAAVAHGPNHPSTAPLLRSVESWSERERRHLEQIAHHITSGRQHIEAQRGRVALLEQRGWDTTVAKNFRAPDIG
jgi:hypothetical protein